MTRAEMAIKKQYTDDELRRIFTKRLDDGLFAEIGSRAVTAAEQREYAKNAPHKLVWIGFERLVLGARRC